MTGRFGDAIDNFLIVVVAIAVVLLLVVMLGSRQSPFRRKLSQILVQNPRTAKHQPLEFNREYYITGEKTMRRPIRGKNPARTEQAVLVQKVDERRRTIDPSGTLKLYNEYYELIFKTRKGDILHLVTSKQAYVNMPFHQQGTLTFQGERLIRFQYADGEVTENQQAFHTSTVSTAVAAGRRSNRHERSVPMQDEELEFEDNLIQLEDEDGNPTSFEFLDLIPYKGKEYVVLLPADEDADEVEILELAELDDEMEEYRSIEDTAILEAVFEIFKEKFKDEFNFED